jgi:feruloyl esterase
MKPQRPNIRAKCRASLLGLLTAALLVAASAQALTRAECLALATIAVPDTAITSVRFFPTIGECRVLGTVEAEIRFELRLPTTAWNGKLYHQGGGGFVGAIPSASTGLERGYATVATDTGHVGDLRDASWALDRPDRQLNWAHRAIHLVTGVADLIVAAAYGRGPSHAYFHGCSNGGRQALMEAQRYPTDFDGIIAGAPALDWTGFIEGSTFDQQAIAEAPVPPAKLTLIAAAVLERCDARDGLIDGLVDSPQRCKFDPAVLECSGGDAPDCLTSAQVEAVAKVYAGPVDSAGEQLQPGFPPGAEDGEGGWEDWITGPSSLGAPRQFFYSAGFLRFFVFSDPAYDLLAFDLDRDRAHIERLAEMLDATDPDLSAFRAAGGKLILWHGWADPALTAYRTIQYYDDVIRAIGNKHEAEDLSRLFLAPGMHHCGGGPGLNRFDALTALERWVEEGIAPDAIVAEHAGSGVARTRPLCAYPSIAVYDGHGDADSAAHFRCKNRGLGYSLKGFESGQ